MNFDQIFDLIFSPETLEEPTNNYYYKRSNEEWNEIYGRDDVLPGETFVNNASTERNEKDESENKDIKAAEKSYFIKYLQSKDFYTLEDVFVSP